MMYLIIGGSGSGKSAYAEELFFSLPDAGKKYYIATMQVYDEESRKRVQKHRKQRADKQFCTVEQPLHVQEAMKQMEDGRKSAMLECVSNLVANEMFSPDSETETMDAEPEDRKEAMNEPDCCGELATANRIAKDIQKLYDEMEHLVIVSNNVFEDGISYDEMTMKYIRVMGLVNQKLAKKADVVTEVVVGIPVTMKKSNALDAAIGS